MTSTITRRGAIATMASGAVVSTIGISIPATANGADAEFFALLEEYRIANADFSAVLDAVEIAEKSGLDLPQAKAAEARACGRDCELFQRVGEAPVHTLDGVRAKLQVLSEYLHDNADDIDTPFVDTALEAVERIGGAS